jgi:hypothetical protein
MSEMQEKFHIKTKVSRDAYYIPELPTNIHLNGTQTHEGNKSNIIDFTETRRILLSTEALYFYKSIENTLQFRTGTTIST